MNESCSVNDDCAKTPRAICNESKICSCSSADTYSQNETRCVSGSLDVSDSCLDDKECQASFGQAQCLEKSCKCLGNHHFIASIKQCIVNKGTFYIFNFQYYYQFSFI